MPSVQGRKLCRSGASKEGMIVAQMTIRILDLLVPAWLAETQLQQHTMQTTLYIYRADHPVDAEECPLSLSRDPWRLCRSHPRWAKGLQSFVQHNQLHKNLEIWQLRAPRQIFQVKPFKAYLRPLKGVNTSHTSYSCKDRT